MRAYLSLPERGGSQAVAGAIRAALAEAGHEELPPAPAALGGVTKSERDHFLLAVDRLHEADLLIADASAPSARVGWEVAWFLARGRLVVVCCTKDARGMLSPMLAGNPSPWQKLVVHADAHELKGALTSLLQG